MTDQQNRSSARRTVVSAVEADGTLIETVLRKATGDTALVIARQGEIETKPEWQFGAETLVPIRATNNLIRHDAVVLPSEPLEYGSTDELALEIERYIRRYLSLPEQALRLSVAYVLLSWVYDAFNELPYLRFRGDYGTGKTRALHIIGSLCYKAFFASGASTVSPIFHTLDTFRGTLVFDEADFRFTDEKAELVKILNNGNARGFPVLRTQVTKMREFDPQAFVIFGPKIVGMRRSYQDRALESRFLTIDMEPGRSADVPINLPDCHKDEALALRNKLLMFRLRTRLSTICDPSLLDRRLEPRMNQILLPLMSVAPEALRFAIRDTGSAVQDGIITERAESAEGHALSTIAGLGGENDGAPLSLDDIAREFVARHAGEYDKPITNRFVGGVLRRLGIKTYKRNGVVVVLPGQDQRIATLASRYGVGHETVPPEPDLRELGR